jgi:hypothetical protein
MLPNPRGSPHKRKRKKSDTQPWVPVAPTRKGSRAGVPYAQIEHFPRAYNNNGVSRVKLFSAHGAAQALEKDRGTIERVVRGLAPDAFERGQPRWRLARIVEALSARVARNNGDRLQHDPALQARFDHLDALDARLRAAPTLQKRRKLARDLFPVLADMDRAMRDDGRRSREYPELTGHRCDRHLQTVLWTLREPCGWSFEEILAEYNSAAEVGAA